MNPSREAAVERAFKSHCGIPEESSLEVNIVDREACLHTFVKAGTYRALTLLFFFSLLFAQFFIFAGSARCEGESLKMFKQVCKDFEEHYAFFHKHSVDWNILKIAYTPKFEAELSPEEFAELLGQMLENFRDSHVAVKAPGSFWKQWSAPYLPNIDYGVLQKYAADSSYEKMGDGVIQHAMIGGNTAHVIVRSLDESRFKSVSEEDLDRLFLRYAHAGAMILDIRDNQGGRYENARRIASRLTEQERTVGYFRYRVKDGENGLSRCFMERIAPSQGASFHGPVVCLIGSKTASAAEWLALMVRSNPRSILVGDVTRGTSTVVKEFQLDNGVSYKMSNYVIYDGLMREVEGRGVAPDISLPAEYSIMDGRDFVLEQALALVGDTAPHTEGSNALLASKKVEGGVYLPGKTSQKAWWLLGGFQNTEGKAESKTKLRFLSGFFQ
jgi:hypothetical protein